MDRHLLGLKILASEAGMETPSIFQDAAYERGLHFSLSTSQVCEPCWEKASFVVELWVWVVIGRMISELRSYFRLNLSSC